MIERKYVKFKVDMFEDTKFKIIDRMPERDVIHYIWVRIVTLAGKINLEGNLYLSKNIPYTLETLAIEFNRDVNQVKLALDTFIKLEMVGFYGDNIYKVKNFVKHQNIKVKSNDKGEEIKKEGAHLKAEETKVNENIDNPKLENVDNNINERNREVESIHADVSGDDSITAKVDNNLKSAPMPILLKEKKSKRATSKKKKKESNIEITDEEVDNGSIVSFYDGDERPLGEGEDVVSAWSF